MSTGFECELVEVKPGEWYYVLQNWDCPAGAWDWREHATAYGPFSTQDETEEHLLRYQSNPGGWWHSEYQEGFEPDEVLAALIADAPANMRRHSARY